MNKLDLRTQEELDAFETEISSARAQEPLPEGTLDFPHYCAVLHHLFQDVTTGQVNPEPSGYQRAAIPFCFPENIESQATKLFDELREADDLRSLDSQRFADQAAHFRVELNAIHAFREGNGRSELTFLALLAHHAGHPLNLDRLDPDEMMTAMIASFDGDEDNPAAVIRGLIA